MLVVEDIQAVPSQTLNIVLNTQQFTLNIYQLSTGLYMDIICPQMTMNLLGVACRNCNPLIIDQYLGCYGDFYFNDTEGTEDPYYDGLGARWQLCYLEPPLLNGSPP